MRTDDVLQLSAKAIAAFMADERALLKLSANERSLTHKLGEHLQRAFPQWNVDCEYNRLGMAIKRLPPAEPIESSDTDGNTIYPDIVVHKRNEPSNLLVLEMKKSTNHKLGDEHKLVSLTAEQGEYGYSVGLHLIVDCEAAAVASIVCYVNGAASETYTAFIKVLLALA